MKQRIVINVPMNEEESRKKVMKISSEMKGVSKVEVVKDMNHLVVVGEGIDSVKLVNSLRKKFCFANILSIHDQTTVSQFEEERRLGEDEGWQPRIRGEYPAPPYDQPGYYYVAAPLYDPNPPTPCSIM